MKLILTIAPILVALLHAPIASAQPGNTPPGSVPPYSQPPAPYYGGGQGYTGAPMPPPPPPSQEREGWNLGLSIGLGSMDSSANGGFQCSGCDVDPPTVGFDLHVGSMVMANLALQAEFWMQSRALDVDGTSSVRQNMLLLAGQYWVMPRLWLKAGVGFTSLSVSYFDGIQDRSDKIGDGAAFMASIGYELMHSRGFGLDLQFKTGMGSYQMNQHEQVTANTIALGANWY